MNAITFSLKPFVDRVSDRHLEQLCQENPDARLETNAEGKLIIMPPMGSLTGEKNSDLNYQIQVWNHQYKLGKVFDSSAGFKLANGAVRSPDASWIELKRWNSLTKKQKQKFAPIDPDFVIELASPSDDLTTLRQKMEEYLSCGVKLGWLIIPNIKKVEIYRQGRAKEVLSNPQTLSGEDVLHNLSITLENIFDD